MAVVRNSTGQDKDVGTPLDDAERLGADACHFLTVDDTDEGDPWLALAAALGRAASRAELAKAMSHGTDASSVAPRQASPLRCP